MFAFFDKPELEPITPLNYLHEYTYPEILEATEPIVDRHGVLWGGKDRKALNAPNATDLWRAWQKAVQKETVVKAPVQNYYQSTKFFDRPPKKGEIELTVQSLTSAGVHSSIIQNVKDLTPRFTWSPSKIMQFFDTCPYQFAAQYYYKTLPYQETEQTIWGNRVHKAAEVYLNGGGETDPEAFKVVEKWVKLLDRIEGQRFVEHQIGVDRDFNPVDYDIAEGRMILDFGVLKDDGEMLLVDWKTGKPKESDTQLRIYALMMGLQYSYVEKISYKYIWLKDGSVTGGEVTRDELPKMAEELQGKLKRMREAWDNEQFPARPSGLCYKYCGCVECVHCGKGRR